VAALSHHESADGAIVPSREKEGDSTNVGGTELNADEIAFCGRPAYGVHEFYALRVIVTGSERQTGSLGERKARSQRSSHAQRVSSRSARL
jgi:hypothetical protein